MTDYTELKRLAEAANAVTSDVNVEMTLASESGPNQAEIDAVTAFMGRATPTAVLALVAENERLAEEVELDNKIIAERDRLLNSIPECAAHGQCVPYAIQWVKDIQTEAKELLEERDQLKAENEALRKSLVDVRESVQREYWDEYAGLEETRAILDAAMGKGEQP